MTSNPAKEYVSMLKRYVEEGARTDYIMPVILAFAPVIVSVFASILFIAGMAASSTGLVVAGLVVYIVAAVLYIYVVYKLIDRRNKHFERTKGLYTTIADAAEALGLPNASAIRMKARELTLKYEEKGAVLWAILGALINILLLYVFHFLNKDFYHHSKDEQVLLHEVFDGLKAKGVAPSFRPEQFVTVPDRNTILYIVLSLITFGIFMLYWIYVLVKDPNEHFKSHRVMEQELVKSFEALVAGQA